MKNHRTKKKKLSVQPARGPPGNDFATGPLYCVLELGPASVWRFLAPVDVSCIIQALRSFLSQKLVDVVALKAIEDFALDNKIHLGRECQCDWIRNLNFISSVNIENYCKKCPPFTVNKTIPILASVNGPQSLLEALVWTKKMLKIVSYANQYDYPTYIPIVCPVSLDGDRDLRSKAAVSRAMNNVFPGAGSHFFYKSKQSIRSDRSADYPDEHWDSINGSSCRYCDNLHSKVQTKSTRWNSSEVKRLRTNCEKLYRPLKTVMQHNLQFVRCIRRPRRQGSHGSAAYEGLIAGITSDGVLCGFYLRVGYWADY